MTDLVCVQRSSTSSYIAHNFYKTENKENCRTYKEWFPWWIGSLETENLITGIILKNFGNNNSENDDSDLDPPIFSVLVSNDAFSWVPVFSQTDHYLKLKEELSFDFSRCLKAKYVKIRLDNAGELCFDQCLLKTETQNSNAIFSASNFSKETLHQAQNSKILLGTLYNESDEFLEYYIHNFLAYTPANASLIINMPSERVIPLKFQLISPRVHIFNGQIKREKWGNTLLLGHIESLIFAQTNLDYFDYFCTMSSNSLLVRPLNIHAIIEQLSLGYDIPISCQRSYNNDIDVNVIDPTYHGTWMWHHFRNSPGLGEYFSNELEIEKATVTQIEGLFADWNNWQLLVNAKEKIEQLESFLSPQNFMALEECIPVSFFKKKGSGKFTHICRMSWVGRHQVNIDDLVNMVPKLPDHISALKWFNRSTEFAPAIAVTAPWSRNILSLTNNCNYSTHDFQSILLAEELIALIKNNYPFCSFLSNWWEDPSKRKQGIIWETKDFHAKRQLIKIPFDNMETSQDFPASIFFEPTNHILSLSLTLSENEAEKTVLHGVCSATDIDQNPITGLHIEAYFYLSSMKKNTIFRLTIPKNTCIPEYIFDHTVIFNGNEYQTVQPDQIQYTENGKELIFITKASLPTQNIWIGIPIYSKSVFEVEISTLTAPEKNLINS